MNVSRIASIAVCAFLLSVLVVAPTKGMAHARTMAPSNCRSDHLDKLNLNYSSREMENIDTTNAQYVVCPIISDDEITMAGTTNTDVHVYDGSTTYDVAAQLCVAYSGITGALCGSPAYSSTYGYNVLHPSRSAWGTYGSGAGHFGYLVVSLPPKTATDLSAFDGFNMNN